jgi:hypothetical protein
MRPVFLEQQRRLERSSLAVASGPVQIYPTRGGRYHFPHCKVRKKCFLETNLLSLNKGYYGSFGMPRNGGLFSNKYS